MKALYNLFSILICSVAIFSSSSANASLMLSISDGTQTKTFSDSNNDGIVGFDSDFMPNIWENSIWNSVSVKGFGTKWYDSISSDTLHLNSIDGTTEKGGTLTIMLSETNLMRNYAPFMASFGGLTHGEIVFQTFVSSNNNMFGMETLLSKGTGTGGSFSTEYVDEVSLANNPYSMTLVATISHTGKSISSFDYEVTVPEPGSLALLGIGLLLLFSKISSRAKNSGTTAI